MVLNPALQNILVVDSDEELRPKVVAVARAASGRESDVASTYLEARDKLDAADVLLVHDPLKAVPDTCTLPSGRGGFALRLVEDFERRNPPGKGAILYGDWTEDWPGGLRHSVPVPIAAVLNAASLEDVVGRLRRPEKPPYYLRIHVNLLPGEGGRSRLLLSVWSEERPRTGEGGAGTEISADEAEEVRHQFREWARQGCKLSELKPIAKRLRDQILKDDVPASLIYWLSRATTHELVVLISGTVETLAYPLDLFLLHEAGESFLANEHPVLWNPCDPPCPSLPQGPSSVSRALLVSANVDGHCREVNRWFLPLRHVDQEIKSVGERILGHGRSALPAMQGPVVLSGENANKEQLERLLEDWTGVDSETHIAFLHWVGHGHFSDEAPDNSGLILWGGRRPNYRPALVTTQEFLRRGRIRSTDPFPSIGLAFFSLCEGAAMAGDDEQADRTFYNGFVHGLARFPIRHLICHRWQVNDCLARRFAEAFYQQLLGEGEPVQTAFHSARRQVAVLATSLRLHEGCEHQDKCERCSLEGTELGREDATWLAPVLIVREQHWGWLS